MGVLTQEHLDRAVWGTGFGSKRHLVYHDRSRLGVKKGPFTEDEIYARCSATTLLTFLDSVPASAHTMSRTTPCARCTKIAEAESIAVNLVGEKN